MTSRSSEWVRANCRFAAPAKADYKRVVLDDPSILGVATPYVVLTGPISRHGDQYQVRFMDPATMRPGSKFMQLDEVRRMSFTPYEGDLVGEDLAQQRGESARQERKERSEQTRLMPATPRVVSRDVSSARPSAPADGAAISLLSPLAGQVVTVRGLPGGLYEVVTPRGTATIGEDLFRQVMRAPDIESAGRIQRKFEQEFGTTEQMRKALPGRFPHLSRYVQRGLVKVLDSSKVFANYREGLDEGGNPAGEAYFKNDVRLFGGGPDDFLNWFQVDWKTPNKRVNQSGETELLRGYYSPQVLLLPDSGWVDRLRASDPEAAEIAAEYGDIPPEVLSEAEGIASKSKGYFPYPGGGVYFNSTDLFRHVLGMSSGKASDLMHSSRLPGGSGARQRAGPGGRSAG